MWDFLSGDKIVSLTDFHSLVERKQCEIIVGIFAQEVYVNHIVPITEPILTVNRLPRASTSAVDSLFSSIYPVAKLQHTLLNGTGNHTMPVRTDIKQETHVAHKAVSEKPFNTVQGHKLCRILHLLVVSPAGTYRHTLLNHSAADGTLDIATPLFTGEIANPSGTRIGHYVRLIFSNHTHDTQRFSGYRIKILKIRVYLPFVVWIHV